MQIKAGHILTEVKMSVQRQDSHNEDVISNGVFYYWALALEVLLLIVVLIYQRHHLQTSLDNRLIL